MRAAAGEANTVRSRKPLGVSENRAPRPTTQRPRGGAAGGGGGEAPRYLLRDALGGVRAGRMESIDAALGAAEAARRGDAAAEKPPAARWRRARPNRVRRW